MPQIAPQSITACPIASDDADGIVREMTEIAKLGMRVCLSAEQVGAVNAALKRIADDLYAFRRDLRDGDEE